MKNSALAVAVLVGAAIAAVAAIDFTGHWTGTATEQGQSPSTLVADLTSSGKTLTGTLTATQGG